MQQRPGKRLRTQAGIFRGSTRQGNEAQPREEAGILRTRGTVEKTSPKTRLEVSARRKQVNTHKKQSNYKANFGKSAESLLPVCNEWCT